jgi:hypothetical protein
VQPLPTVGQAAGEVLAQDMVNVQTTWLSISTKSPAPERPREARSFLKRRSILLELEIARRDWPAGAIAFFGGGPSWRDSRELGAVGFALRLELNIQLLRGERALVEGKCGHATV